jgi:malate synthase
LPKPNKVPATLPGQYNSVSEESTMNMNMTMTQSNSQPLDPFIHQEISTIHALNDQHLQQILDYSKGFLDKHFPLAQGSHQNVSSYVVYYQHLLAFMTDGSQTGLANPSQFVALSGSRQKPQSILLRAAGRHVELWFGHSSMHQTKDCAGIADIQLELVESQLELVDSKPTAEAVRWFSMVRGQLSQDGINNGRKQRCYTSKEGNDYWL